MAQLLRSAPGELSVFVPLYTQLENRKSRLIRTKLNLLYFLGLTFFQFASAHLYEKVTASILFDHKIYLCQGK